MNLAIIWAVCGLCAGFLLGFGWGVSVKCPNFRRSSQNQTVSSGVEGAHEGTTADKSGSREPDKLNNAQKLLREAIRLVLRGGTNAECATFVALAESSLSSPPPKED